MGTALVIPVPLENNGFMDLGKWIKQADQDLREGRGRQIAISLNELKRTAIPRRWKKPVAMICRRAGLFAEGLKILTPVVHPPHQKDAPATVEERAEYAALLMKHGSVREAAQILTQLPADAGGEVALYKGFCHMAEWNYGAAAAELRAYILSGPSEYQELVASVNLSACLVGAGEYKSALDLLNRNIERARNLNAFRLEGNSLELRAQVHLYQGRYSAAEVDLSASAHLLMQDPGNDLLYIKKWQAVLGALRTGSLAEVNQVREVAYKKRHWESLRDLDRFRLRVQFDPSLFDYLLFGTPHADFRARVLRELNQGAPQKTYRFGAAEGPVIHVQTGEIDRGGELDRQLLNVLAALSRDFYRPSRVGELFGILCPDQHFDIFTSHNRIAKIMSRARQNLREMGLPITIENQDGALRLQLTGPVSLLLEYDRASRSDALFEKLRLQFHHQRFSAHEACRVLEISRPKFQRWFKNAEAGHKIEKLSSGALTEYRLKAS